MSDPSAGVTPPPPGTPAIPVAPTSDNPGMASPAQAGPPQPQPGAYAQGQPAYGAPPTPPAPRQPNPLIENLKAELIGTFPTPIDAPQGKLWAILSYFPGVFLPLWLVPLVRRNNHLSLFHAKQMLAFAAIEIPVSIVFMIVNVFIRKIPTAGFVLSIIASVLLGLAFLLVAIIGLLGAARGQVKPLPLIGRQADRMLRGLTVCPPVVNPEPQLAYWQRVAPVSARPSAPQAPAPQQPQGWAQPHATHPPAPQPPAPQPMQPPQPPPGA